MRNDCIFCAIADGEIPSFKIYEDDEVLAYLDINPFSEGHTLVIPKEHREGLGGIAGSYSLETSISSLFPADLSASVTSKQKAVNAPLCVPTSTPFTRTVATCDAPSQRRK